MKTLKGRRYEIAQGQHLDGHQVLQYRQRWSEQGYELPELIIDEPREPRTKTPGVGDIFAGKIGKWAPLLTSAGKGCKACADLRRKMNRAGWAAANQDHIVSELLSRRGRLAALVPEGLAEACIRKWLTESIAEHAATVKARPKRKVQQRRRRPNGTARPAPLDIVEPQLFTGPVTRNLICHIFPVVGRWRDLVSALQDNAELFNGYRDFCIMTAPGDVVNFRGRTLKLDTPLTVRNELQKMSCSTRLVTRTNVVKRGEFVSFPDLVSGVETDDPNTITFYCHSKGAKHPDSNMPGINAWVEAMLGPLTDQAAVEAAFCRGYDIVGSVGADVFGLQRDVPAGSFYWYRNSAAPPVMKHKQNGFATSEEWPSRFRSSTYLLGSVSDKPRPYKPLYTHQFWTTGDGQTLMSRWHKSRIEPLPSEPLVTLVTPTGDRPAAFDLCERWMSQQTHTGPVQWIVVDDGKLPTTTTQGQEYIRRKPAKGHTLPQQLATAIPHIRGDVVLIIEDDDYYHPDYIRLMLSQLQTAEIVGERGARYYYLPSASYRHYHEHTHSSLCRTGMRASVLPTLDEIVATSDQTIDLQLWKRWQGTKQQWQSTTIGCVGIKGMPGRRSLNAVRQETIDHNLQTFQKWCPDWKAYQQWLPVTESTAVAFSVNFGGYDLPYEMPSQEMPVVLVTDSAQADGWNVQRVNVTEKKFDSRRWKIKACDRFPDAEWILYFDGQLRPIKPLAEWLAWARAHGDADLYVYHHHQRHCIYAEGKECARIRKDKRPVITKQLTRYRQQGYPENAGLYLGGIHIRRNCESVRKFERIWWDEVQAGSLRDQISLPVAIARSGVNMIALPPHGWTQHFERVHHGKSQPVTERMSAADKVAWAEFSDAETP